MLNNLEKNEIKFDFGERLINIAWMELDGVRAINTTFAGGDFLIIKGKHSSLCYARPKNLKRHRGQPMSKQS